MKHRTSLIKGIKIDRKIVPLIKTLWAAGYRTNNSCQGSGAETWLGFDNSADLLMFIGILLKVQECWCKKASDEKTVILMAKVRRFFNTYSIHFPTSMIPKVIKELRKK